MDDFIDVYAEVDNDKNTVTLHLGQHSGFSRVDRYQQRTTDRTMGHFNWWHHSVIVLSAMRTIVGK